MARGRAIATEPARHRFTVEEYHRMAKAGIFTEDDRVELLDGEIVEMAPIGRGHAYHVRNLISLFVQRFGQQAIVDAQNPIRLNDVSEPQPDLMLLKLPKERYRDRLPAPDDVLLLIEVADTSAAFERRVKLPMYARAGIPEVWLMDINQVEIEVHRDPSPQGYRSVKRLAKGQRLAPEALPDVELSVEELLG